ncbi:MAG: DsbE family thiol:disulfide interchange protein [Pseudomonadota bacterium]|nr:DsbE family thiol:disulfide interchange protein [Pseudomonadota bacterium]
MNRLLAAVPVIGLLGLAAMLGVGLTQDPQKLPSTLIGQTVPPFDLPPIAPDIPALAHTAFQGQVSLLNVFGSWCTSCLVEHPVLLSLARRGAVPIYGLDWKDEPGAGAAWLARHGNPYTAVGDDASGRVALDLGVTGAPETYVIDAAGIIRHKQIGPITDTVWRETLEPLVTRLRANSS